MNRRKFFKRFGQGVAAAVVAPTVLASLPEERVITKDEFDVNFTDYKEEPVGPIEIDHDRLRQYPLTPKECCEPKRQNFVSMYDYCGDYHSLLEDFNSEMELKHLLLKR